MMSLSVLKIDSFAFGRTSNSYNGVLYETTGTLVPENLKELIQDAGISVIESSEIQIAAVVAEKGNDAGNAIIVTNENGDVETRDVLLLVDEDGITSFEIPSSNGISPLSLGMEGM